MPDHSTPRNPSKTTKSPKQETERLSILSPADASWDEQGNRAQTTREWMLRGNEWQNKKAENMESCGKWLLFAIKKQGNHVLKDARFCRTRLCPRCQWRRANAWKARWIAAWPAIHASAPKARYFHLTLTAPTIPATELKERLDSMNKAWMRMTKKKGWPAIGFARSTEVTVRPHGHVHPHFHCLVMVSASYFSKNYMSAEVWLEWWADAMRLDVVKDFKNNKPHIRAIKTTEDIPNAVKEVFKYAVKGVGSKDEEIDDEWIETFLELDRQLKGTRAQALGGLIKKAFKDQGEITEEEMLGVNENPDEETVAFWLYMWNAYRRWYARSRVLEADEVEFLEIKDAEKKKRKGALKAPLVPELLATPEQKEDWEWNKLALKIMSEENLSEKTKKAKARKRRDDAASID